MDEASFSVRLLLVFGLTKSASFRFSVAQRREFVKSDEYVFNAFEAKHGVSNDTIPHH